MTDSAQLTPEQIDRRIAAAMGYPWYDRPTEWPYGQCPPVPQPCYTDSLHGLGRILMDNDNRSVGERFEPSNDVAAAFMVVEWMRKQGWDGDLTWEDDVFYSQFWRPDYGGPHSYGLVQSDTPAAAISRAAFAALEAQQL